MKQLILIFLIFPFFTIAQTNNSISVKLIDYTKNKIAPACGKAAFATTLKFEMMLDFDSLKKGDNILVVITCPSDFNIKFKNNNVYYITLCNDEETKAKEVHNWSMVYKYENEKLPRFWCQKIEKLKVYYY